MEKFINDTLKDKKGRWDHIKLTKFGVISCMMACTFYDVFKSGELKEFLLLTWLSAALGDSFVGLQKRKQDLAISTAEKKENE